MWVHRIDSVPKPGSAVRIMLSDGNVFMASVEERTPRHGEGIGAHVQYVIADDHRIRHGEIVPGHTIQKWSNE